MRILAFAKDKVFLGICSVMVLLCLLLVLCMSAIPHNSYSMRNVAAINEKIDLQQNPEAQNLYSRIGAYPISRPNRIKYGDKISYYKSIDGSVNVFTLIDRDGYVVISIPTESLHPTVFDEEKMPVSLAAIRQLALKEVDGQLAGYPAKFLSDRFRYSYEAHVGEPIDYTYPYYHNSKEKQLVIKKEMGFVEFLSEDMNYIYIVTWLSSNGYSFHKFSKNDELYALRKIGFLPPKQGLVGIADITPSGDLIAYTWTFYPMHIGVYVYKISEDKHYILDVPYSSGGAIQYIPKSVYDKLSEIVPASTTHNSSKVNP
ncbi:MAG: hypothetical protein SFY68_03525 [Candidatus Sumerlaeia bacterium]|nr:hypothetical protein [Candidatus Sumerlaeia bacterium]